MASFNSNWQSSRGPSDMVGQDLIASTQHGKRAGPGAHEFGKHCIKISKNQQRLEL